MRKLYAATLGSVFSSVLFITPATASSIHDFSLTYLNGSNYELGDPDREVLTFEHKGEFDWGDSFIYIDRFRSNNGDTETYAEISPRLNIAEFPYNHRFMAASVATTWEAGDGFDNYLIGLGTDWQASGFDYLRLNFYRRNNQHFASNYQVTARWGVPLGNLYYDGFIDWSSTSDGHQAEVNFTSQLKYDFSTIAGFDKPLYVGMEIVLWNNKFGIADVDERNLNFLVKVHF